MVHDAGYELTHDMSDEHQAIRPAFFDGPWIVPVGSTFSTKTVMARSAPSDLHRRFARLARAKQDPFGRYLRFAKQWGLLNDHGDNRETMKPVLVNDSGIVYGESTHEWWRRAERVAIWIKWWEALRDEDAGLAKHFTWDGSALRCFIGYTDGELVPDVDRADHYLTRVYGSGQWLPIATTGTQRGDRLFSVYPALRGPRFDVEAAARFVLYEAIDEGLKRNIRAVLDMQREASRAMVLYPVGLWGVVWMHFAREVMGHSAEMARCARPGCDNAFQPRRRDHRWCSEACRVWGDRQRRKG